MFMMSFFLRGMSFVDMAFLRKSDLDGGRVTYRRRKTGQQLTVGWTREMQAIVDKYPCNPTQYLLPIITRKDIDERQVYRNISSSINSNLKNWQHLSIHHSGLQCIAPATAGLRQQEPRGCL